MKKLALAAALLLAAPAAAQSRDTAVIGGYDALKWGADRARVTTFWNEQPLSETTDRGLTRMRFKTYNGMDWTLAVHDQRGFVQLEAAGAQTLPVAACEAVFDYYHQAFTKLYSHITPAGGKRNDAGGSICEAVKAGRGEARYSWTDPVNGAIATLQINRDGRTGYTMAAPFYREWASAAPSRLGVTAAAFAAIRPGMTLEEVNALIGSAGTQASSTEIGGSRSAGYTWSGRGGNAIILSFLNGRVAGGLQSGLYGQPSAGAAATMAKFSQLKEGMTLEEVSRIMGGPGRLTSFTDIGGRTMMGYIWPGPSLGSAAIASFLDGRLKSQTHMGLR